MNLGNRIKELRLQKHMTQKDVVGEFMTRNMLSKIENGSATPSIRTLEYLAKAFGEPVSYFLDDAGSEILSSADDAAQLTEIEALADQLLEGPDEQRVRCLSLCVKTQVLLARGNPGAALSLLENALSEEWAAENAELLYKTAEDCCARTDDFKQAYLYVTKRLNLSDNERNKNT